MSDTNRPEATTLPRPAQLIAEARAAQKYSLREMGDALGASHQHIKQIEDGKATPDRALVGRWIKDDRPWVRRLGLDIFGAVYQSLIDIVLEPTLA